MVTEIAVIQIKPGTDKEFEAAVKQARPVFQQAHGCQSFALKRSVENPLEYHLVVGWATVDDHMVTFRNSPGFQTWRGLASPFFSQPPVVQHVSDVLTGF